MVEVKEMVYGSLKNVFSKGWLPNRGQAASAERHFRHQRGELF